MTTPQQAVTLRMPNLDQDALEQSIQVQFVQADIDIKTRSQIRLESSEARCAELKAEGESIRTQMARLRRNIAKLEEIYTVMQTNEQDVAVELAAELALANQLKQAGV